MAGAAPIQASILAGDTHTGVCTQRMEEGLDTGPLYLSASVALAPDETAGSLHDTLMQLSARVAVDTLAILEDTTPVPQSEDGICGPKIEKVRWSSALDDVRPRPEIAGFAP